MRSKKLAVAGVYGMFDSAHAEGREIWTVGRNPCPKASRYYELHGKTFPEYGDRVYTRSICPELLADKTVPLGNTVCAMLMEAAYEGYTDVVIINCPLCSGTEYIRERMCLAYCIAVCRIKFNMVVAWEPLDTEAGKRYGTLASITL